MFFLSEMEAFPALFYIVPGKYWTSWIASSLCYMCIWLLFAFSPKNVDKK